MVRIDTKQLGLISRMPLKDYHIYTHYNAINLNLIESIYYTLFLGAQYAI